VDELGEDVVDQLGRRVAEQGVERRAHPANAELEVDDREQAPESCAKRSGSTPGGGATASSMASSLVRAMEGRLSCAAP
jgi:hypothetical protein